MGIPQRNLNIPNILILYGGACFNKIDMILMQCCVIRYFDIFSIIMTHKKEVLCGNVLNIEIPA